MSCNTYQSLSQWDRCFSKNFINESRARQCWHLSPSFFTELSEITHFWCLHIFYTLRIHIFMYYNMMLPIHLLLIDLIAFKKWHSHWTISYIYISIEMCNVLFIPLDFFFPITFFLVLINKNVWRLKSTVDVQCKHIHEQFFCCIILFHFIYFPHKFDYFNTVHVCDLLYLG